MRILSWNINGIRTLPQYHPWNMHKTGGAILAALEADIICFQEMKIQRAALEKHIAAPDGFDGFFSFPATKGGYSGVAVYAKTETVAPLKAEEGLTGVLQPTPPLAADERVSVTYPEAHDIEFFPDEAAPAPPSLAELDTEGRALVLDFGLFVLVNVYCPAETSPARLPYKMNFHRALQARVRRLIEDEGREVVVIGDLNVAAAPLDHGDGHLASVQAEFWEHPPRAWLRDWLAPAGPMVDAVREAWPDRRGMYTCWNTKISARAANYGSRIDYVLLTRGLRPWLRHADIQPAVRGSDHCPVFVDLHDEIRLASGTVVALRDAMCYEAARRRPPRLSTRFWREFSGTQRLLSNFFAKKGVTAADTDPPDGLSQDSAIDVPSSQPEDVTLLNTPTPPSSLAPPQPEDATLIDIPAPPSSSGPPQPDDLTCIGTPTPPSSATTPQPSSSAPAPHRASSSQKKKRDNDSPGKPPKKKRKVGQTTISSFFAKPPQASSSRPRTPLADERSQLEADYKLARSLSNSFGSERAEPRPASAQSKAAWTHLLAPLQPPKCRAHGEPCKELTVGKPGPNKGKTFFICSRPVGPGYDKGRAERLREEVDVQYRCNFFKWASEVKREALKGSRGVEGETEGAEAEGVADALRLDSLGQ